MGKAPLSLIKYCLHSTRKYIVYATVIPHPEDIIFGRLFIWPLLHMRWRQRHYSYISIVSPASNYIIKYSSTMHIYIRATTNIFIIPITPQSILSHSYTYIFDNTRSLTLYPPPNKISLSLPLYPHRFHHINFTTFHIQHLFL